MTEADRRFVIRAFTIAIIFWGSGMMFALLIGLFSPTVDNREIFKILGPIASNVPSAAISIVSALVGYRVAKSEERKHREPQSQRLPVPAPHRAGHHR